MKRIFVLVAFLLSFTYLHAQIEIVERKNNNVVLVGKISHTSAYQTKGLDRKLPILVPFDLAGNANVNKYKEVREEANAAFKTVRLRKMQFIDEDFSASLLFFEDKNKYLMTFQNSQYNYQNESFWMSEQTKIELHELIMRELSQGYKYKTIELLLEDEIVLVLAINRKKVSFNFWDGYTWIQSYWYRKFKVTNLFGL